MYEQQSLAHNIEWLLSNKNACFWDACLKTKWKMDTDLNVCVELRDSKASLHKMYQYISDIGSYELSDEEYETLLITLLYLVLIAPVIILLWSLMTPSLPFSSATPSKHLDPSDLK